MLQEKGSETEAGRILTENTKFSNIAQSDEDGFYLRSQTTEVAGTSSVISVLHITVAEIGVLGKSAAFCGYYLRSFCSVLANDTVVEENRSAVSRKPPSDSHRNCFNL